MCRHDFGIQQTLVKALMSQLATDSPESIGYLTESLTACHSCIEHVSGHIAPEGMLQDGQVKPRLRGH